MNANRSVVIVLVTLASSALAAPAAPKIPANAKTVAAAYKSLEAGKFAAARTTAARLLSDRDYGDLALWIATLADLGEAGKALSNKQGAQARKLAEHGFEQAARIETRFPYSPLTHESARLMGQAELAQGDASILEKSLAKARRSYEAGFQRLVSGGFLAYVSRSSLAGYNTACLSAKANSTDAALCSAWIQRFASVYPKRSAEFEAATDSRDAEIQASRSNHGGGGRPTQSYKAPDLDMAAFDGALERVLAKKYGDAIEQFEKFQADYPKSTYRYRARFWYGQALARKGDKEKAQQANVALTQESPMTFYGLAASIASGTTLTPSDVVPTEQKRDTMLQPADLLRLNRAEALLAAGAKEAAALDLRGIPVRDSFSSGFLMYLADLQNQAGNHSHCFSFLTELFGRRYENMFSSTVLPMVFPSRLYEIVKKVAEEEKVDPILAISLVKQESGFDSTAISSSGAMGMSQLMHATALDIDPKLERAQLLEIERNLHIGIRYLGKLLTRFKGNVMLSLAAYNAGPAAVDRWVRDLLQDRSWLEFVELIPYKESREYVTSILRNYYWYTRILNTGPVPTLDSLWVQPVPKGAVSAPSPIPEVSPTGPTAPTE